MGRVFGMRFGCGGTFGEDDDHSFCMSIQTTRNKMKKHYVAIDDHQMTKKHTTINQKELFVKEGGVMMR
jgi:hypothetical protein